VGVRERHIENNVEESVLDLIQDNFLEVKRKIRIFGHRRGFETHREYT
jgi:hypothetical protein